MLIATQGANICASGGRPSQEHLACLESIFITVDQPRANGGVSRLGILSTGGVKVELSANGLQELEQSYLALVKALVEAMNLVHAASSIGFKSVPR
jgi:hypothetical protein